MRLIRIHTKIKNIAQEASFLNKENILIVGFQIFSALFMYDFLKIASKSIINSRQSGKTVYFA